MLQLLHAPHVQLVPLQVRVRVWFAQPPGHARVSISGEPGVQVADVVQVGPSTHAPQVQVPAQVRVPGRVPSPQAPHADVRISVAPIAHSPSSLQAHAPQVQSMPHVRACVPQLPQVPPISTSPIEHGPPPTHTPSSRQTPPSQTCRCVPQCIQGTVRGASPSVQSQLVGAVQAAQAPSVQRSTPSAHDELHGRSAMRPTLALASSQSTSEGTPSMSRSIEARQISSTHA